MLLTRCVCLPPLLCVADDEILRQRQIANTCNAHPQHRLTDPLIGVSAGYAIAFNSSGCLQPALQWAYTRLQFFEDGTDQVRQLQADFIDGNRCVESDGSTTARVSFHQVGFLIYVYAVVWLLLLIPMIAKFAPTSWVNAMMPQIMQAQ